MGDSKFVTTTPKESARIEKQIRYQERKKAKREAVPVKRDS